MLFNQVQNKENYIEFDDDNYIYKYYESIVTNKDRVLWKDCR